MNPVTLSIYALIFSFAVLVVKSAIIPVNDLPYASTISFSSPTDILDEFDFKLYEQPHLNDYGPPMPWQSVVHSFTHSVQIDFKGLNNHEVNVLYKRRHTICQDLERYYAGESKDNFEMVYSDYSGRLFLHTAASHRPIHLWYPPRWAANFLNPNTDNPYFGWHYRAIGSGQYAMAVKELPDGTWHLSFAKFMYFRSPY